MNPLYETAYVAAAMALIDRADFGVRGEFTVACGVSPWGASLAATGAADLALYRGQSMRRRRSWKRVSPGIAPTSLMPRPRES